jgi:hypothetical protein
MKVKILKIENLIFVLVVVVFSFILSPSSFSSMQQHLPNQLFPTSVLPLNFLDICYYFSIKLINNELQGFLKVAD